MAQLSAGPASAPATLNPRYQAYIHPYLETGNGTEAAILSGYAEKAATAAA